MDYFEITCSYLNLSLCNRPGLWSFVIMYFIPYLSRGAGGEGVDNGAELYFFASCCLVIDKMEIPCAAVDTVAICCLTTDFFFFFSFVRWKLQSPL